MRPPHTHTHTPWNVHVPGRGEGNRAAQRTWPCDVKGFHREEEALAHLPKDIFFGHHLARRAGRAQGERVGRGQLRGSPLRTPKFRTTSSKVTARVSDARCPMLSSLRPSEMPAVSASTMKPVKASLGLASFLQHPTAVTFSRNHQPGERSGRPHMVRARTKNQLAWPAPVIHILLPLITLIRSAKERGQRGRGK